MAFAPFRGFGQPAAATRAAHSLSDPIAEEDEGILSSIGRSVMSGLAVAGNLLDVPGSMLRDVLTGNNPFDQLADPFGDTNRISGRDMLEEWGWLDENEEGLDLGDAGGFTAEVLADPLTYLTFGTSAITKAGRVAKAAGVLGDAGKVAGRGVGRSQARAQTSLGDLLAKTPGSKRPAVQQAMQNYAQKKGWNLNDLMDEKLGGGFGIGFPLGPTLYSPTGAVGRAAAKASDALGTAAGAIPGVRPLRALFDRRMRGGSTRPSQVVMRGISDAEDAGRLAAREIGTESMAALREAEKVLGREVTPQEFRAYAEGLATPPAQIQGQIDRATAKFKAEFNARKARFQQMGRSAKELDDLFISPQGPGSTADMRNYWPRHPTGEWGIGRAGKISSAQDPLRMDVYRDIPGGTAQLEDAASEAYDILYKNNGTVADVEAMLAAKGIPDNYRHWDKVTKQFVDVDDGRIAALAARWSEMAPSQLKRGIFGNHPIVDAERTLIGINESLSKSEEFLNTLADPSIRAMKGVTDGDVPLAKMLRGAGFTNVDRASQWIANKAGMNPDDVLKWTFNEDFADEMSRGLELFTSPKAAGKIMQAIDGFTKIFKVGVLSWPARFVRDLTGGQMRNFLAGNFSMPSLYNAARLMRGKPIHGWKKYADVPWVKDSLARQRMAPTAENVTEVLRQRARTEGLLGPDTSQLAAATRPSMGTVDWDDLHGSRTAFEAEQPGLKPFYFRQALKKLPKKKGQKWSGFLGVGTPDQHWGFAGWGGDVGYGVEGLNRISPWLEEVGRGTASAQAARKVIRQQVDYSGRALTDFERKWMLRIFPFYRFSRGNIPYVLRSLIEHPGGRMAQMTRAANTMRGDAVAPEYVQSGMSIGLDPGPGGEDRYLTGAGFMFENAMEQVFGPEHGATMISSANPLIKTPLELAFGESTFQRGPKGGRELEDIDPTFGRMLSNLMGEEDPIGIPGGATSEALLAASPASRLFSTTRVAADPRKSTIEKLANVLSGFRTTTISDKAKDSIIREALEKRMKGKGAYAFEKVTFSKAELEKMDPATRAEAEEMMRLSALLAIRSKQRKQAKKD